MEIGVGFVPTNKEFAIPTINFSSNLPKYGGRNET